MAESSGFFADVSGDREYTSDWLAKYISSIVGNGTYDGELGVTADGSAMSVTLPSGRAWINGYYYCNDGNLTLAIDNAGGVLNRKDIAVLRWDVNARSIAAQVIKGAQASTAVAPSITRTAEQYDLKLAEISVPAGTTAITQSMITDCRLDKSVCGIVTGAVTQVDTTAFYNQIQADLAKFKGTNEAEFTTWKNAKYTEFQSWLSTMQNIPPADVAAYLQGQINSRAYSRLDCKKAGTVYALSGLTVASGLVPCVFKADADYNFGDTFTMDGDAISAVLPDGSGLEDGFFKAGMVMTAVYDTDNKALNFKSGGSDYDTLPAQVSNFYATRDNAKVTLNWTNPGDTNFAGVLILRKTGSYPQRPSDGDRVYSGTGTSYADTGLTNGTQYCYRAYAYNSKKQYQTLYCVATGTPLEGYRLDSMPVGIKIKFGSIFGNKIIQRVTNLDGSDVTLIADKIIVRYAIDASEGNSGSVGYYGNNRYSQSNIHQWLNSGAGAGEWYTAQHSEDAPPSYSSAAGFLNGFTNNEKELLKAKSIVAVNSRASPAVAETLNARVWLPSKTELGLTSDYTEGTKFAGFSDNNSRKTTSTADADAQTPDKTTMQHCYWSRTPNLTSWTCAILPDGTSPYSYATDSSYGIRPCCCLDGSAMLHPEPDSDGCYILEEG
jgi:hypothetical protein